ncbi:gas vesicle protein GvpH [Halopelagius fulvigenes]|uniref:Gas vesicle protein GvpH n=1 Tax=Halopelagius fulvigenes TaxID=1198324 RepID=A0ABD5TYY8_9EURY
MHDSNDDDENRSDDRDGVSLGAGLRALTDLLSALGKRNRKSGSGLFDTDRSSVEYRYSVESGLGDGPEHERSTRDSLGRTPRKERPRTKRRTNADLPSAVSHDEDVAVVTVDLRDFDPDDVTVGLDGDELVVAVDGSQVDRIPVDVPPDRNTTARLNNGVLQVRIEPEGGRDR